MKVICSLRQTTHYSYISSMQLSLINGAVFDLQLAMNSGYELMAQTDVR